MRFGCCVNMQATVASAVGNENIPVVLEAGYDYIELPLAEVMALDDADYAALCRLVERTLPCEAMNNFFPKNMRLTGPDLDKAVIANYTDQALDRAATLGAKVAVFGSGAAKTVPQGFSTTRAFEQLVEVSRIIGEYAARRGILVVHEPLNRGECNILNTYAEGCRLLSVARAPSTGMLVDAYHMALDDDPAAIAASGVVPGHVHLSSPHTAEGKVRRFPKEGDGWDHGPLLEALRTVGYDGRVSIEAFSDDLACDAPLALDFMRQHLGKGGPL